MEHDPVQLRLSLFSRFLKRSLDIVVAGVGLILVGWIIFIAWIVMTINTRQQGFFLQDRVGRRGKVFRIIKIRTMRSCDSQFTTVTRSDDPRITGLGHIVRKCKIDELPQFINVFAGSMSIVGPRPDVPGFADNLTGLDKSVLCLRPGITGVASLAFRNEESLLSLQPNPEKHNLEVMFPEKTRLNLLYIENYSILRDVGYILETLTGIVLVKNDGR